MSFVPDDFDVPLRYETDTFVLVPLTVEHNERDHDAWMSSLDHIRSTPGFPDGSWPREMSLEDNARDLERHARHFAERRGFTYTVLDRGEREVLGCVYIYPGAADGTAVVQSWVRASHAELDLDLYRTVCAWLTDRWPFNRVEYAPR